MNNLLIRTLTGVIFVVVLLGSILWNKYSFGVFFFIITLLGIWEFYRISEKEANKIQKIMGTFVGLIFFITCALVSWGFDIKILLINIPLLFMVFSFELFSKSSDPFANIAFTVLGIVYVALPFSLLNFIVFFTHDYNSMILVGCFLILWANDTGAYLFGSMLGKHKLFERISPKKTKEGFIGGALCSLIVAYFISRFVIDLHLLDWIVIGLIFIVIGTLGDLVESLYKRSLNMKDSGNILPGHGGILDRFDSLLLASPFVFTYLYLIR